MISPPSTPYEDPIPAWRTTLGQASAETMIKLLVDVSSWAQSHPQSPAAWTLLGDAYLKIKQPYAAEKAFRHALGIDVDDARAREGLGLSLLNTGQAARAAKQLARAHELAPFDPEILVHWGLALMEVHDLKAAYKRFKMALERDVSNVQAWLNLGLVDIRRGAWGAAIDHFRKALEIRSDFAPALHNLALISRHTGALAQALHATQTLTDKHPEVAAHWRLLAELQLNAGETAASAMALQRARALDPGNPELYITQAALYVAQRDYTDAEAVLKTALTLGRDDPNIQLEMGLLHLLQGRFDTGWDLHESRKLIAMSPVRRFPIPDWLGEDLTGQTVLVHAEQGLGDTILFAHCLPDLLQQAERVVIEVSTRLEPLFARSFPTATVVGRDPQGVDMDWLSKLSPPASFQAPIGSLPHHFRRSADQFPRHGGYLVADPDRVAHWRRKLAAFGQPVIGLAWRGGLLQTGRAQRSMELNQWVPRLIDLPIHWVSLQYGETAADEADQAQRRGLRLSHWPDTLVNQDDVAALTCALDAVVTVCSTQAHMTGALGRPGWVLVPYSPNWRYGSAGETMLWYPSLKLLRQTRPGDWSDPLDSLQRELRASPFPALHRP